MLHPTLGALVHAVRNVAFVRLSTASSSPTLTSSPDPHATLCRLTDSRCAESVSTVLAALGALPWALYACYDAPKTVKTDFAYFPWSSITPPVVASFMVS